MRRISFSCKAAVVAVLCLLASTPLKAQTVELKMPTTLLVGSKDPEGVEKYLIDEEEVESGF